MPKTFLNISICIDSDDPLDALQAQVKEDIEYFYSDRDVAVFSVTWDRDQALAYLKDLEQPVEKLGRPELLHSEDVVSVFTAMNLPLPKLKPGAPEWRTPKKLLVGEVEGLSTMRGRVLATDGILALLVREDGKWDYVHWCHFIPDDLDDLGDLPKPEKKVRVVKEKEVFVGF